MAPAPAPDPSANIPPIPPMPTWAQIKVFLWGALWTVGGALAPAATIVVDWLRRWDDPIDWSMVGHMAAVSAVLSLIGYWRKHKALLSPPPPPEVKA